MMYCQFQMIAGGNLDFKHVWKTILHEEVKKIKRKQENRQMQKSKNCLSLRKLELLWITTVNHILYHDAWVSCQRIRKSVWQRETGGEGKKRDSVSNKASNRVQTDIRVHQRIVSGNSRCFYCYLLQEQTNKSGKDLLVRLKKTP